MTDLGPLPPCPVHKRGAHDLAYFIPEDGTGDITAMCCRCGTTRRVPASGALQPGSLDDMTPEQITARIGWTLREVSE